MPPQRGYPTAHGQSRTPVEMAAGGDIRLFQFLTKPIGGPAEIDLAPDVESLPCTVREKTPASRAAALLVAAAACAYGAYAGWRSGLGLNAWIGIVVFGAGSIAMAWSAVRNTLFPKVWTFRPSAVTCSRRTPFGRRQWTEPLANYRGVLASAAHVATHYYRFSLHRVVLQHRQRKRRSVTLYLSRSPEDFRRKHKHYARLFGLPALMETPEGLEQQAVEDVGRSVREQVAARRLDVGFDASSPPPGRALAVRIEDECLVMRARAYGLVLACSGVATLALVTGVVILAAAFLIGEPAAFLFAVLCAAELLLVAAAALAPVMVPNELAVSPQEVRTRWRHLGGTFRESAIPADEVEQVLLTKAGRGRKPTAVEIISDAKTIRFGAHLTRKQMEWVRDCIIAVIGR